MTDRFSSGTHSGTTTTGAAAAMAPWRLSRWMAWLGDRVGRLGLRAAPDSGHQALFAHSPSPALIHDQNLVVDANDAAVQLFGYANAKELQGRNWRQLCPDDSSRQRFERRIHRIWSAPPGTHLPPTREVLLNRQGQAIHVRISCCKGLWNGQDALFTHLVDESATVRAEQARRDSESLLQGVFDASPFAISISEPGSGQLQKVNAAYCRMIGYRIEQIIGRSTTDFGLWPEGSSQRDRVVQALREAGHPEFFRERLRRQDGQLITVHGGTAFVGDPQKPQLLFIGTDVTAELNKQAELEAIVAHAPVAIMVTEGPIIRSAGPRLRELSGVVDLKPEGMHVAELWRDPQCFASIQALCAQQLATQGRVELVRPHQRPDGSIIQLRVEGAMLKAEGLSNRSMVWIISDVTAEMEAFRAREVAEASSQAKSAFLAVMSHELRTPLNGILGLAELARSRDTKAAERKEYLKQLADCANSLADILNDILDLSKIEAGRMEITPEAVNLRAFFERLQSTYTSLAEARGLELRFWIDSELPRNLLLDPVRLRQILANYLGNALKFTPSGLIELTASAIDGRLHVEVRDSGIGIPEELLPRLFTPFEQARNTSRSQTAGTGLGLAICLQLARLMGGDVGARSEPGSGSQFWVALPMVRPDAHAVARAQEHEQEAEFNLSGVRVLLAEDNEINALITMRALTSAGALAVRVINGQEAVDAAEAAHREGQPFAVVLMDVQMPVMDGIQATRELRMRPWGQHLRIIALTAGALAEVRDECRVAGMDGHLTKPLHRDRLLAEVLLQSKLTGSGLGAAELKF